MKHVALLLLLAVASCQNRQEKKSTIDELSDAASESFIISKDSLFVLHEKSNENIVQIVAPEHYAFELPDSSAKTEAFKKADFNADKKEDILVYLGACGTGGCMYALFLNQYDNFYRLALMDYLKNAEFNVGKNGYLTIVSSEELEAFDPSKMQITTLAFDKSKYEYIVDTTFVYHEKEVE